MSLSLRAIEDLALHRCGPICTPCARPGCWHCDTAHHEMVGECTEPSCSGCTRHVIEGDCLTCDGSGYITEYVTFVGLKDVRCGDCFEGKTA